MSYLLQLLNSEENDRNSVNIDELEEINFVHTPQANYIFVKALLDKISYCDSTYFIRQYKLFGMIIL